MNQAVEFVSRGDHQSMAEVLWRLLEFGESKVLVATAPLRQKMKMTSVEHSVDYETTWLRCKRGAVAAEVGTRCELQVNGNVWESTQSLGFALSLFANKASEGGSPLKGDVREAKPGGPEGATTLESVFLISGNEGVLEVRVRQNSDEYLTVYRPR